MRLDVKFTLEMIKKMDKGFIKSNKAELTRRLNCDVKTISKYLNDNCCTSGNS